MCRVKAAKYEIQKPSTCRATLFRCKFSSMFPVFHLTCNLVPRAFPQAREKALGTRLPYMINLTRNKNTCCGLKKVVAKSRARVYFEQQILALLLVFSSNSKLVAPQNCSCPSKSTNQRAAFFQPATNVFVAGQVDHARLKTGNIDENLERNNIARQVEGFCISYFAPLRTRRNN